MSGNPGGRPKTKELEQYAREHGAAAIDRLMEIGRRGRGVSAVKALELVLAYGYGRPKHQVAITGGGGGGPPSAAFAGAARLMLEAAIAAAEGDKPDEQSGAPVQVIDVTVSNSEQLPPADAGGVAVGTQPEPASAGDRSDP